MQLLQHFKELTIHPKNTEELKGLVLQLAIQGKLTANWREKNPAIEPASELLIRIQKEKTELVKKKKIKKEKVLPKLTEEEIPYEVPKSWVWCRVRETGFTQTGSTPPKKNPENYGNFIPFIGPADISNQLMKYPVAGLSKLGISIGRLIPKNSLMMVCIGGSIGKCNINQIDVSCNQQINTVTPIFIPSVYIKAVCQSPFFQKNVLGKASGSATPIINKGKWEALPIPLPPLEEQKEIVKVVETLFKEVEQLEQLTVQRIGLKEDFVTSALHQLTTNNAKQVWAFLQDHFKSFFNETTNIKKLRETILQLAVQGKLTADWRQQQSLSGAKVEDASILLKRIQEEKAQLIKDKKIKRKKILAPITEDKIPYELPNGWVWCRLQDLVNVGTGSTPAKSNSSYYDGTIPWYTSSATNDLYAKESEKLITEKALQETNCKVFPKGTLIIAMYGQGKTRGQISELVIPGATNQAVAAMVFYKTSKDSKEYIKYFFRKIYDEIRLLAEGGAQPNLNVSKIKNTILPLPPLEEQKAIVEKVNALMGLCDALEEEVQQSQEHSEMLMQSVLREVF
ncbi:restriction endonuclease subunit S [Tenacibaculum sp. ZS6-P6]|uniref:restriction endonuclease subunit S n=1 Tax=Tenacibaculum sp. ZS6-P6 TaxID=3447503 RepID=UPI003F94DEBC